MSDGQRDAMIKQLAVKEAKIAMLTEALKYAQPWVEGGPKGPWRDGVLAKIKAALKAALG
jgi:hypothetical protein